MVSINGRWFDVVVQRGRGLLRIGDGAVGVKTYAADEDRGTLEVFGATERERLCNAFHAGQELAAVVGTPAVECNVEPVTLAGRVPFGTPPGITSGCAHRLRRLL